MGTSVITLDDLTVTQIEELLHKAQYIDSHRKEVAPVSYTHLDVYKRQVIWCVTFANVGRI